VSGGAPAEPGSCIGTVCSGNGKAAGVGCAEGDTLTASVHVQPNPNHTLPRPQELAAEEVTLVAVPEGRANSFVGTEEYLAPEVINGVGHTAAVDWCRPARSGPAVSQHAWTAVLVLVPDGIKGVGGPWAGVASCTAGFLSASMHAACIDGLVLVQSSCSVSLAGRCCHVHVRPENTLLLPRQASAGTPGWSGMPRQRDQLKQRRVLAAAGGALGS